ncbi:MAG: ATP-binding protein [Proteobacteria bacterium]|uniref:ATP-binding protein n=1 Tax=Candidatus Avisuccinivibrio stercorigallinarum TaxID=2840704 RepID=A0A9D9DES1_9GAMM|nr:ATP-binding protein [Candidatus Avisuccinivibrio stercorigallinarum]
MGAVKIRPRERGAIIQSLRAGVTPRVGLEHIQVGRVNEIKALIEDLERICEGGSAFRLIIGDFGAGKSFFLQLVRYIALEKGMVVMNADLAPDRRLYATGGQARALFQELARNIATRAHPEGNAMVPIVEKFITEQRKIADTEGRDVSEIIKEKLSSLTEMVGGYDFAQVIAAYWEGYNNGDENLKAAAVRYLRGEYGTKTEAKRDLNVRTIVDDATVYDHIKLLSRFVCQAGFKGLLVNLDEMVNLYKLHSQRARASNYEQILRILNDCLQGSAENLGFLMGGTPDFLTDERKGLYSYEALRSRLSANTFAQVANVVDYKGPVLTLQNLTPEELYVLLFNIRNVFANYDKDKYLVPDEALTAFLQHCSQNIGEAYFRTPRNTIKAFVDLLSIIEQNPELKWETLLSSVKVESETDPSLVTIENGQRVISSDEPDADDDELTDFKL